MRKDKPYIDKKGRAVGHRLFFAVLCLCLPLMSCTNDEATLPDEDDSCRVTLRLDVSSFGQQDAGITRSVAGNSDENLIKDLWVFQFNKQTGGQMKEPVYISESQLGGITDDISADFAANASGESSIVCVVANTHDDRWTKDEYGQILEEFKTYSSFLQQALPSGVSVPFLSSNMGDTGGKTIPMFGKLDEIVIASKAYIRVPLKRMFARVHVLVDPSYPAAHHLRIKRITYINVPFYSRVEEITRKEDYPADVKWEEHIEEGANEYTLYMPENRQGVVPDISDKSDSSLFPEHALAIKVALVHTSMAEGAEDDGHKHEYTVYPGGDVENDFNIKRNCIYNVIIKIKSEPGSDTIKPEP